MTDLNDTSNKYVKAVKNTMENIYNDDMTKLSKIKIEDAIKRVSKIDFHTYNFLSFYFMHLDNNNLDFPYIDDDFIRNIMVTVTKRSDNRGTGCRKDSTKEQIVIFKKFYDNHYKSLLIDNDIPLYDNLTQILLYEAADIVKNIENNIKQHYIQHVRKLVDAYFDVKQKINEIKYDKTLSHKKKNAQMKEIRDTYNPIKNDILNPLPFNKMTPTSKKEFHEWITNIKPKITPNKKSYLKDSMAYDVMAHPQDYLKAMFGINKELSDINKTIDKENNQNKDNQRPLETLFRVLPLRTSIIPRHITIDSFALVMLLVRDRKQDYLKHITEKSDEIWSLMFDLKNPIFKKKGYAFHHMIKTDGVSCSIIFVKLDPKGNPYNLRTMFKKNLQEDSNGIPYIENAEITNQMKNKTLVGIDPNHGNLISCKSKSKETDHKITATDAKENTIVYEHKESKDFRYTRAQRNVETRSKKYNKIREKIKSETKITTAMKASKPTKIKTVEEIETELSQFNSKDANKVAFRSYLKGKIITNRLLYKHYGQPLYRKLKMNVYINTQKSESKMIRNFKHMFGPPERVLIVFGDYDKTETMRGCEPHISKRMKRLFMINGYELYHINEYNTSKLCNKCGHENEQFMYHKKKLLWGLLRCTNEMCKTIHNRDHNSSRNMIKITESIFAGKGRPKEYTRIINKLP